MKFKEIFSIKWRPLSIFYLRSLAFVVDIIPLNKIFVTVIFVLQERHLIVDFVSSHF